MTAAASGRFPYRARRGDRGRAVDRRRTGRAGDDEHGLAQRVAPPRARLPAYVLGRRHIVCHLLAPPASAHVAAGLVFGYGDGLVNALLDIDGVRESHVVLVAVELHRSAIDPSSIQKWVRNAVIESA